MQSSVVERRAAKCSRQGRTAASLFEQLDESTFDPVDHARHSHATFASLSESRGICEAAITSAEWWFDLLLTGASWLVYGGVWPPATLCGWPVRGFLGAQTR